jgi:hypothetical protein
MRYLFCYIVIAIFLFSCTGPATVAKKEGEKQELKGTWKLISGTTVEKGDTTVTVYSGDLSFIKIINDTHFAFLNHDLSKGKGQSPSFTAGGGRYELKDSLYTEHLEYCSDRAWEGNDFSFTVTIQNDTLIQKGIEKVDEAGVYRLNIEKYSRVKE